jgi:hypothetical protein
MVGLQNGIKKEDGRGNVVDDNVAFCVKPVLALHYSCYAILRYLAVCSVVCTICAVR